jgi:hypothetical protein
VFEIAVQIFMHQQTASFFNPDLIASVIGQDIHVTHNKLEHKYVLFKVLLHSPGKTKKLCKILFIV